MRFCPFCSAENAEIASHCGTCARRLPPLPPRRRKSEAESGPVESMVPAPDTAPTQASETPSLLARVAMGPAAMRREREPEIRAPGDPSRRSTDLSEAEIAAEVAGSRRRSTPPPPSRVERDRDATARASRRVSLPGESGPAAQAGSSSSDFRLPRQPSAAELAARSPSAPPVAAAPAGDRSAPRVLTARPASTNGSPPLRQPSSPAGDAVAPQAAPRIDPADPMPGDSHEWPAPARRDPTPDPDDWATDAQQVMESVGPRAAPVTPAVAPVSPMAAPRPASPAPAPPAPAPAPPAPAPAPAPPRGDSHDAIPRAVDPPPTRVHSGGEHTFKPPAVRPIPDVPESGLFNAVRYALSFARARWQRRAAINELSGEIKEETAALDGILGTLGRQARSLQVDNRVLSVENGAIDDAERRRARCEQECFDLSARQADENNKFAEVEGEREGKSQDAEQSLERARRDLAALDAQRRALREKRKTLERQQKAYLKAADERDEQASRAAIGDARAGLRRAAEDMRRDAAALDPERQDIDRRLSALDKPLSQATAKAEALKAEHDSARRSLNDAREGHRHRLAELEAEQGRKSRELAQCEAEIQRRLVTLGTLVNLHRIQRPEFDDMYSHIDALRAAIGARSTEIDRMTAEREAYDKGSLIRGFVVLAGGLVALVTLIVIILAIF